VTDSSADRWKNGRDWLVPGALAGAACVAVSLLSLAGTRAQTVDDVFILLVHARHLARDGVIAWNLRDGHVDGCTSFLDLLIKSFAYRFVSEDSLQNDFYITCALQAVVPLIGAGLIAWLARSGGPRRAIAAGMLAGMLLGTSPALADGSSYLLETPLVAATGLLLLGTFVLAERFTAPVLALLVVEAILVALARPEGALLGAGALAAVTLDPARRPAVTDGQRAWLAFSGTMALYYAWHLQYFGFLAPNTYYAKTSSVLLNEIEDGLHYVADYARTLPGAIALLPILVLPLAVVRGRLSAAARFNVGVLAAAALGTLTAVIYSGGDCYTGGRFLALPIAIGGWGLVVAWLAATGTARAALLASAVGVAFAQTVGVLMKVPDARDQVQSWPLKDDTFQCVGLFAAALQRAVPGGSVAETDYQLVKYYADGLEVIDLPGLSDRAIAHRPEPGHVRWGKTDLADVLRRRPEAFLWGTTPSRDRSMAEVSPRQLVSEYRTHRYFTRTKELPPKEIADGLVDLYLTASIPICGRPFNLLVRKDVAPRFTETGFTVGSAE
jgi:hypothetical protein